MDHTKSLAFEIWQQIITAACTDGGYTGRSLALTDKFFHEQSLSSRLHSLAFNSVRQVEGFIAFLHAQPEGCVPRIRHLYLSILGSEEPSEPPFHHHQPSTGNEGAALPNRVDGFDSTASELLAIAAPTLVTLCILERPYTKPDLPDLHGPFPQLEELTVNGPLSRVLHARTATTFPKLKRLHLISSVYGAPYESAIAYPRTLTHFRLSDACSEEKLTEILRELLEISHPEEPARNASSGPTSEPHKAGTRVKKSRKSRIRHVIVHSNEPGPAGCAHPYMEWAEAWEEIQVLGQRVESRGVRFLFLEWPWWRTMRWADRLHRDWLERISDIRHRGCWVETEEEEVQRGCFDEDPRKDYSMCAFWD